MKIIKIKDKEHYYDITDIDSTKALYRLIIGQRSNGKTYAVTKNIIDEFFKSGKPSVYFRRYGEDVKPSNISKLLAPHENYINKKSKGLYNSTAIIKGCLHFVKIENNKTVEISDPVLYIASLSQWEHLKGQDRGEVVYIVFDEFCTRAKYLPDEFIIFSNLISSFMRDRPVKAVYMLANTVNTYCPYWLEMGLYNIENMKKGQISVYNYSGGLSVAVEYCAAATATNKINKYFAFDNPRLNMICNGDWEQANYRHLQDRYTKEDIYITFLVKFQGHFARGNIYKKGVNLIVFFHQCEPPDEITGHELLYTDEPIQSIYHSNSFKHIKSEKQRLINNLINTNRDYYSNNTVGEFIRNFIKEGETIAI